MSKRNGVAKLYNFNSLDLKSVINSRSSISSIKKFIVSLKSKVHFPFKNHINLIVEAFTQTCFLLGF